MDDSCPDVEILVACFSCGTQTLPPYMLCVEAHISCPSCYKYIKKCACGKAFTAGPHLALNGFVEGLKLKCRYAIASNGDRNADSVCYAAACRGTWEAMKRFLSNDCNDCWYSISELREHYRTGCQKNGFMCPMKGCDHFSSADTIIEHYEEAHGPIEDITPEEPLQTNSITFKIDMTREEPKTVIRKVFNGYFLCSPMKPRDGRPSRNHLKQVSLRNINPCDSLQYTYTSSITARVATVKISLLAI